MRKKPIFWAFGIIVAALAALTIFASFNPIQVDASRSVIIAASSEEIWSYAGDFEGEFEKSNPDHDGLTITSVPKEPFRSGLRFEQFEYVGGIRGRLNGVVFDGYPLKRLRWKADTNYKIWGINIIEIEEGGTLRIEPTEEGEGYRVSHRIFGRYPNTFRGRTVSWFMTAFFGIQEDAAEHTLTELEYFKRQIER